MIEFKNITRDYTNRRNKIRALNDISFYINEGEFVIIHGPSGCGKTTLLLTAGGLLKPSSGNVIIYDQDLYLLGHKKRNKIRAQYIGFVFQQYHLIPYLTVIENIMITGLAQKEKIQEQAVFELLKNLGLKNRYNHNPDELSAGEKQRTALARAVIYEPNLILADEITGNLDMNNTERILQFLRNYTETGKTVILATHNKSASKYADRTIKLN